MKVCVQGLWHLGSVTSACLASLGHEVIGLGSDSQVVSMLSEGQAPISEPGLNGLLFSGVADKSLRFTTDANTALDNAEVLWVTFDTPVDDEDIADVNFVIEEVKKVLPLLQNQALVLVSSQLPVGSIKSLEQYVNNFLPSKGIQFAVSPENLRLGKSLDVFLNPDRIIVGVRSAVARKKIEDLLFPVTQKIEWMSIESAEMTKHAINSFLATSVTFVNEIAAICELVGADAKEVERGLKTESRIGPKAYLSPGGAFAGGTLARDVEFLAGVGNEKHLVTPLLSSIRASNDEHKNWVRRKLSAFFSSNFSECTIALWGLTYKPGTDTLRRSLAVELCDWLIERGAKVKVYDPAVNQLPARWLGKVTRSTEALETVVDADVLVVGTEWPEFRIMASKLNDFSKPDLIIIDANRHLNGLVDMANVNYVAVGSPENRGIQDA